MRARTGAVDSPTLAKNRRRNDDGLWWRTPRWRHSRAQLWKLLDRHIPAGARVAITGAGNGHDLPLRSLARRAGELWLFDLDGEALRRAKRRAGRRAGVQAVDVTFGAADEILGAALRERQPLPLGPIKPLPGGPFDVVIVDLIYSQLLYPALADNGLPAMAIDDCLTRHRQRLTDHVARTCHASAPGGLVVHLHDVLGWWPGHSQPFAATDIVRLASRDPAAAVELTSRANRPLGCDPISTLSSLGVEVLDSSMWIWPFAPGVEYLVHAVVPPGGPTGGSHARHHAMARAA